MWTTMNDEQKIWIVGSYFHYSASEGWTDIEGYDLFSSTSKELIFDKKTETSEAAYVVQASKSTLPSLEEQPFEHLSTRLSGARFMEPDDRKYNVSLVVCYKMPCHSVITNAVFASAKPASECGGQGGFRGLCCYQTTSDLQRAQG
jgi:hypothetical protein